jgi:hypothetical protein
MCCFPIFNGFMYHTNVFIIPQMFKYFITSWSKTSSVLRSFLPVNAILVFYVAFTNCLPQFIDVRVDSLLYKSRSLTTRNQTDIDIHTYIPPGPQTTDVTGHTKHLSDVSIYQHNLITSISNFNYYYSRINAATLYWSRVMELLFKTLPPNGVFSSN